MPSDYYSDAAAPAAPADAAASPDMPETPPEDSQEQTAEVPKALLGGKDFQPGDEVVLEVVQIMEDSVLVKYASGNEEETTPDEPVESPSAPEEAAAPGMESSGNPMY